MSPFCPWCGGKNLVKTTTVGRFECTYCGLIALAPFKTVPPPTPWPAVEPSANPPLDSCSKKK